MWRHVFSSGAHDAETWWTVQELPHVGTPWLFRYVYARRPE